MVGKIVHAIHFLKTEVYFNMYYDDYMYDREDDEDDGRYRCVCDVEYDSDTGTSTVHRCDWCLYKEEQERQMAERERAREKLRVKSVLEDFCMRHLHGNDYVEEQLFNASSVWRENYSSISQTVWQLRGISLQGRFVSKMKVYLNYFLKHKERVSKCMNSYFYLHQHCRNILAIEALLPLHAMCEEILAIELKPSSCETTALRSFLHMVEVMHGPDERLPIVKRFFEYVQTIGPFMKTHPTFTKAFIAKLEELKAEPKASPILDTLAAAEVFINQLA